MKSKLFLLLSSIALFGAANFSHYFMEFNPTLIVEDFEKQLHQKEERLVSEMKQLEERSKTLSYEALFAQKPVYYNSLFDKYGLVLLIYEKDSLKYWSDNSVAVETWRKQLCLDTKIIKLPNGWFEVVKSGDFESSEKSVLGLLLIKSEFPYQNKYLNNSFQQDFSVPPYTKLFIDFKPNSFRINDLNKNYLFSLQFASMQNSTPSYLELFLSVIACILLIVAVRGILKVLTQNVDSNYELVLFSIAILLLRYLSIKLSFPKAFYENALFAPNIYADSSSMWLSSLGDLLVNTLLIFYVGYTFKKYFKIPSDWFSYNSKYEVYAISVIIMLYVFCWSIISYVIIGLVNNSNISFSVNNIFSLNLYSYIALLIIALLLLISFFISDATIKLVNESSLHLRKKIVLFLVLLFTSILLKYLLGLPYISLVMLFVLFVLINYLNRQDTNYSFSKIVILVFAYSFFSGYLIYYSSHLKEIESRKIIAEKIAAEQDPVAEYLFNEIDNKIQNDTLLISYLTSSNKQLFEFEKRIREVYFSGFWDKYDTRILFFDNQCLPLIKQSNPVFDNNQYFEDQISKKSLPTPNKHLYFIQDESGKLNYIAKIEFYDSLKVSLGKLYVDLEAKLYSNEIGFPELLLDKKLTPSDNFENYSYAKYRNGKLVLQYGKFNYASNDLDFNKSTSVYYVQNKDEYSHLLFHPDLETLIVVSMNYDGPYEYITTFSFLFTYFTLFLLILFFIRQIINKSLFENLSFKYRIQFLLVSIVLISMILFGGGTVYYIEQQFKEKNRENISEKIRSVLVDVENKIGDENSLKETFSEYYTYLLKKSSNVFFTDVNIFDKSGNLFVTSRPKIFDRGLISRKMNAEAYLQMSVLGKREFTHDEKIGKLEYLSSYIQFKNKEGKNLGYINLPYFSKQTELEKEIAGFIVALINIYVLLFVFSIVLAIIISNYITQPLLLIQEKLSKIKLGKINDLIDWKEKDEIGSLVSEYNRMVMELTKSAELLAKSERESAWREMAKQVAHEIKNPLTPMKLSIQHLQRLQQDGSQDMENKIKQLTQTLIEQIDSLSAIANEFSNFAKMPKATIERVNLNEVIMNVISLFKEIGSIELSYNKLNDTPFVIADKDQLLRVFNNLIKNAIQAIPQDKLGKITVDILQDNNCYTVRIKDNGTGISNADLDKIFVPNFTTKTGGMGLGLAMVKNIIEGINGKVWFENNAEGGATFYVSLPAAVSYQ